MTNRVLNVVIDTNIFITSKFDLSANGNLSILKEYVEKGLINVYLSNIVYKETLKHIKLEVDKYIEPLNKIYKDSQNDRHISVDTLQRIGLPTTKLNKKEYEDKAIEYFDTYLKSLNFSILTSDNVNIDNIIEDYFSNKPPFEDKNDKKSEFPDAIIAEQVKQYFGKTDNLAIVTNDKGLAKALGDNYKVYSELNTLLDEINRNENTYEACINLVNELKPEIEDEIYQMIDNNLIKISVAGLSQDRGGVYYGYDYDETEVRECKIKSISTFTINNITEDYFVAKIKCKVQFEMNCYYSDYDNAPYDYENKEYFDVPRYYVEEKHIANFPLTIEISPKTKGFKIYGITLVLGGDSRKATSDPELIGGYGYDYNKEDE